MRGKDFKRLPSTVVPINYALTLEPDLKNLTFSGSESVNVVVNEDTKQVILNSLELNITSASFKTENGLTIKADKIDISEEDETVVINFNQSLTRGSGQLDIQFNGILNDKLKGFYRCEYETSGHEKRYAAVTQFQSTDARRAFPCWDEPALKASFEVTLIVPNNRVALSNMNIVSQTDRQDLKVVKFAKTPSMSTYLLAFIVGEYDFVEVIAKDGLIIRVYTPVGKRDQGLFALEVAERALPYYKEYFNIGYPLPKMDLITISNFYFGAMENWGLVTYRESCLLVDPKNTSANSKQWIALIVAHELAHQWFGNLVTMEWWTDLWLNEGFASFIEFLCVDKLFEEYSIWPQFVSDVYTKAIELDALNNSHPIEVPVSHPSEIDEAFDTISYNKGASIIRMLYEFIGDEFFRKGLNLYLTKHSYKNSTTEDLWSALDEVSHKPIGDIMNTWTKQKGFPVISVKSRKSGQNLILNLTQEKFCANGRVPELESGYLWFIPISISSGSAPEKTIIEVLMDSKTMEIEIPNAANDDWIKLNPNTVGFYRVQYSSELLNPLIKSVEDKSLPSLDRLGLQNDLFALVKAGRASTLELFQLLDAFYDEECYTVWNSIDSCLERINKLLSNTDIQPLFHSYSRRLLAKTYAKLGWEPIRGETHLDTLLRGLVINRLASFGDKAVIEVAKNVFWSHFDGKQTISPDLRAAVYNAVAVDCDEKTFEALFKLYRETDLNEEKNRISKALGSVTDEDRIEKVLNFSLSKEVKNQDAVHAIVSVALTKSGRDKAWKFFKDNSIELRDRYVAGFLLTRLVQNITENFASEERALEIETFFAENPFPGSERTLRQSLENIRLNCDWLSRDYKSIENFLLKYSN